MIETIIKDSEDFINEFCEQVEKLIPHKFIAKKQGEFLQHAKQNLIEGEYVIISDFSENYSFVVQNEIQGFHWANKQCTPVPFTHL